MKSNDTTFICCFVFIIMLNSCMIQASVLKIEGAVTASSAAQPSQSPTP